MSSNILELNSLVNTNRLKQAGQQSSLDAGQHELHALKMQLIERQQELELTTTTHDDLSLLLPPLQSKLNQNAHTLSHVLNELALESARLDHATAAAAQCKKTTLHKKQAFVHHIRQCVAKENDKENEKTVQAKARQDQLDNVVQLQALKEKLTQALVKRKTKLNAALVTDLVTEQARLTEQHRALTLQREETLAGVKNQEIKRHSALNQQQGLLRLETDLEKRFNQLKKDLKAVRRANKQAQRTQQRALNAGGVDDIEENSSDDDFV